jgi:hypothetical protein
MAAAPTAKSGSTSDLGFDSFAIATTTLTLGTGSGVSIYVRLSR